TRDNCDPTFEANTRRHDGFRFYTTALHAASKSTPRGPRPPPQATLAGSARFFEWPSATTRAEVVPTMDLRACLLASLLLTAADCGDAAAGSPGGDIDAAAALDAYAVLDAYAAPHGPFPQVPNHGGRVLHHPQLVTVTPAAIPSPRKSNRSAT